MLENFYWERDAFAVCSIIWFAAATVCVFYGKKT